MTTTTTAPTAPQTLRGAWIALTGLSAVFLFEMLDNSILNVALPTIGRELTATATGLQWVTGAYSVVFGGLMLLFGAVADRSGRRRTMLVGLALLAVAGAATAFVTTPGELIAVRALMGAAAAMTTPGSIALAFRLFPDDALRVRAISLVSLVGIVGLAVGPVVGGLALAVAPWQALLLVDVPVALLALVAIRAGVPRDEAGDLHRDPLDVAGALIGTATVVLALVAPTLFVQAGAGSWAPWTATAAAAAGAVAFAVRERSARHPMLDLRLVARPLVSAGLLYKVATGLALASLNWLVGLQLQLDYGWSPALAAVGMLPQVAVLIGLSPFVERILRRLGFPRTAWLSAASVVAGLVVYGLMNAAGYLWIALSLVLVAAGIRINGVVAGNDVLRGLPQDRTSIGSALVDTVQEVATGAGVTVAGTVVAALVAGSIASGVWDAAQRSAFHAGAAGTALALGAVAAAAVIWGRLRARGAEDPAA